MVQNRWKSYCETLYSTCKSTEEVKLGGEREPTSTYEEEKALKVMRTRKTEGPDEIPAELLKLGGDSVTKAMNKITSVTGLRIGHNPPPYHFSRKETRQYVLTTA